MPSIQKWSNSLIDWFDEIEVSDEFSKLSTKNIMLEKFRLFMNDVDYTFDVFKTKELNDELKEKFNKMFLFSHLDMPVSIEPEYLWRIKFEYLFMKHIDRYNKLLRLQFVTLIENEDEIFKNYDLKSKFDEQETTKNVGSLDKDTTLTDNQTVKEKMDKDVSRETNKDSDNITGSFNREIFEDTPNGQLNITTQDGSGVITTATNITESKDNGTSKTLDKTTDDSNELTNIDTLSDKTTKGTDDRKTTSDTDRDKENLREITGYQNLPSKGKLLADYTSLYSDTLSNFNNLFDPLFAHNF